MRMAQVCDFCGEIPKQKHILKTTGGDVFIFCCLPCAHSWLNIVILR